MKPEPGQTLYEIGNLLNGQQDKGPVPEPWVAEKKAFAEGKVIESRYWGEGHWQVILNPEWRADCQYRVVPQPERTEPPSTECTGDRLQKAMVAIGFGKPSIDQAMIREEAKLRTEFAVPVDSNPWVRASDRLPRQEDADEYGNVEVWLDDWSTENDCPVPWSWNHIALTKDHQSRASWRRIVRPEPRKKDAFEKLWEADAVGGDAQDKAFAKRFYLAGQQSKEESK